MESPAAFLFSGLIDVLILYCGFEFVRRIRPRMLEECWTLRASSLLKAVFLVLGVRTLAIVYPESENNLWMVLATGLIMLMLADIVGLILYRSVNGPDLTADGALIKTIRALFNADEGNVMDIELYQRFCSSEEAPKLQQHVFFRKLRKAAELGLLSEDRFWRPGEQPGELVRAYRYSLVEDVEV